MPTTVKICGIKDLATAQLAKSLGADYLGLVFTQSRRQVTISEAYQWMSELPDARFIAVGLDMSEVLFEALLMGPFWGIQIHGEAPPDWIGRTHQTGKKAIATEENRDADVVLLDGVTPGSGIPRVWEKPLWDGPIWMAGGLTPDTVRSVVERLRPEGVDVSSGVEVDGNKSGELIARFIEEVRHGDNKGT